MGGLGLTLVIALCLLMGWRNFPPLSDGQSLVAGFCVAIALLLAWLSGRHRWGASAQAVSIAQAKAEAAARARSESMSSSTASQQQVLIVNAGASRQGQEDTGLENAPWLIGAQPKATLGDALPEDVYLDAILDQQRETEL